MCGVVNLAYTMEPVTLQSSLRIGQSSLCRNNTVVSFRCTTASSIVFWEVGDRNRTRLIAFNSDQVGELQRRNGNYAILLRCSAEEGCVSILYVESAHSDMTIVQCSDGTYSVEMEYYHGIPGVYYVILIMH